MFCNPHAGSSQQRLPSSSRSCDAPVPIMPATPRNYHLNFDASNELVAQGERAKTTLERIAADLAATEPDRLPHERDLVEPKHILRAAQMLFGVESPSKLDRSGSQPPASS